MCFCLCASVPLVAQIAPSRTWLVDQARRAAPSGPLASLMGGVEMYRGWFSHEEEQAWQLRTHFVVEPYRWEGADSGLVWTTSLEFHQELTANPRSDIGFSPRTARWEEQLLVHVAGADWSARAGWFHRCKHDIDVGKIRTLILSGPTVAAMTAPIVSGGWTFRGAAGVEWFVVNDDYRLPGSPTTGLWSGMSGAAWVQANASLTLSQHLALGGSYHLRLPWFTDRYGAPDDIVVPHDARAELMLSIMSTVAVADVVISAEHIFDEVALVTATPSTYLQVGLRFRPR